MEIQETLARVRAKYGPTPSTDECGEIVNETAWIHRADGWGVSGKPSGNHARRHDGTFIAADVLQNAQDMMAYDVLRAAGGGGPGEPAWQPLGVLNDPGRPWVAPIAPVGVPTPPPPTPPPDPEPPPIPEHCVLCAECLAVLKAQSASANEQRQLMIQMIAKLPTFEEVRALVAELRANPLPVKIRF